MRIISTAWGIFRQHDEEIELMRDGGSIMIHDICEYVGRIAESFLFTGNFGIAEIQYGNIRVLDNRRYLPDERTAENINEWQNGLRKRFFDILDEYKPDLVLVHGGREFSSNCIMGCMERKQEFAYVDHLMQSGNAGFAMLPKDSCWEKKIFQIPNIHIIAVGNGMRKKIMQENAQLDERQVVAIPNGTPMIDNRAWYTALQREDRTDKRLLLCVGSLQPRKNQLQLVSTFAILPDNVKETLEIWICGSSSAKNGYNERIEKEIDLFNLQKSVKIIGEFPREKMPEMYANADALIMPSFSEGLSLVALEMLSFGKPIIMFSDNETAEDVKDDKVAVFANGHSDQALADAIVDWYNRTWDSGYIQGFASYFSMERVAKDYVKYAKNCVKESRI